MRNLSRSAPLTGGGTISGDLTIDGDLTVNGDGSYAYSEVLTGDMKITNSAAATGLTIQQTGAHYALKIDQDTNNTSLEIDSECTSDNVVNFNSPANTSGNIINIASADALTTGAAISIDSGGTALASTATGGLVEILHSGDSDSNVNNLLYIINDDAGSTGTTGLKIQQDSTGPALVAMGSVGIGTNDPDANMHIHKASAGTISAHSDAVLAVENSGNTAITILSGDGSHGQIHFGDDGQNDDGVLGYDQTSNKFYVLTNHSTTKKLVVDANGKIGINSATPTHGKVEIIGDSDAYQLVMSDVADDDDTIKEARIGMMHYKQAEPPVTLMFAQSAGAGNTIYIGGGTGSGNHATSVAIATAPTYNSTTTTTNMIVDNDSRISLSNNDDGIGNTIFGKDAGDSNGAGDYNVFIGEGSGNLGTQTDAADYNIAIGKIALEDLTSGDSNVAIGAGAAANVLGGVENISIGRGSLTTMAGDADTDTVNNGHRNIAIGRDAMGAVNAGSHNTATTNDNIAIGNDALLGANFSIHSRNLVGNIAIGSQALDATSDNAHTGTIAIGHNALTALTSGIRNTTVGFESGLNATTADDNVAIGYESMGGNVGTALTGNGNTVMGSYAGRDMQGAAAGNTLVGKDSGIALTTGNFNVLIGRDCGDSLVDETHNTAIGTDALGASSLVDRTVIVGSQAGLGAMTADADGTVAVGYEALNNLTAGAGNVAVGYQALMTEDGAGKNVAIGHQSLKVLDSGVTDSYNTAIGYNTMLAATGSIENVAIGGNAAIALITGDNNVIIGTGAGSSTEDVDKAVIIGCPAGQGVMTDAADGTVAIGYAALNNLTAGAGNVAVGYQAGNILTTGGTNTIIGWDADVDANDRDGCVIIGSGLSLNTASDNVVEIGNDTNSMTYDLDGGDITVTSDVRTKKDIKDSKLGLEFINRLRPITYKTKPSSQYPKEFDVKQPSKKSSNKVWDGLIAQEVKEVMNEMEVGFSGWEEGINTKQRLAYGKFVMPLIKAVQELTAKVKALEDA